MADVTITGPASWWQFWKSGVLAADEAWVVQKLGQVKQGVDVTVHDLNSALQWIFANFDEIAKDVEQLIVVANMVGAGANPTVVAAEAAATAILSAIAAAKAASAAAQPTDTAQLAAAAGAAYASVKQLQIAQANAAVTVATGEPPK